LNALTMQKLAAAKAGRLMRS